MAGAKVLTSGHIDTPENIRFKYLFAGDFRPEYANGAQGQITPQSEITINFFLERSAIPYSETHRVVDGTVGDLVASEPSRSPKEVLVIRQITGGVVLNPPTAIRVYHLLGQLLESMGMSLATPGDK